MPLELNDSRPRRRVSLEAVAALGGLTAALLSPHIFSEVFEYPLLLALSVACRPGVFDFRALRRLAATVRSWATGSGGAGGLTDADRRRTFAFLLIVAAGLFGIYCARWAISAFRLPAGEGEVTIVVVTIFTVLLFAQYNCPANQIPTALLMSVAIILLPSAVRQGDAQRSYYGVSRVQVTTDGEFRTLWHGTTMHGAQRIRDARGNPVDDTTPATYYYSNGPMARTIAKVQERLGEDKGRFSIIGLGAGSLACYSREGETWRFFGALG